MSRTLLCSALLVLGYAGCASLQLEGADFGWPVESALPVGPDNRITDDRYAVSAAVGGLAEAEFGDTTALRGTTLRMLRSTAGYYFVTGDRFAHVYVFTAGDGVLAGHGRIRVVPDEEGAPGLRNPALNQRPPYVELLDQSGVKMFLTADEVVPAEEARGGAR